MLVDIKRTKEVPVMIGFFDTMSPINDKMFINRKIKVIFLFPKFFNIFELFVSNISVTRDATVYNIPTYFSDIILTKNVELTYAERAI